MLERRRFLQAGLWGGLASLAGHVPQVLRAHPAAESMLGKV